MLIRKGVFFHAIGQIVLCAFVISKIMITSPANLANPELEAFIGMISIISLANFFFSISRTCKEYFSIAVLFVVFMYLFNLGIPISRLFGWINEDTEAFLNRRVYLMGHDTFLNYSAYCLVLISGLQQGVLFRIARVKKRKSVENINDYESKLKECSYMAKLCVAIGVVPYCYQEMVYIGASMVNAYQSFVIDLSGTGVGLIGSIFVLGIFLQLIAWQNDYFKFHILFYIFSIFQIVRMFITGDRSTGIAILLVFLLIRHKFVKPLNPKKIVLYLFYAYIGMLAIKLIELTRSSVDYNFSEIFQELMQSNMLVDTINEYGGNVWCGMMVYYSVPSTGDFRYGLTYLASIIGKPLQILGITDKVWKFADFANFINDPARGSVIMAAKGVFGGSFSGEWYFNFGYVGLILIIPFGYLLATFSDACVDRSKHPIIMGYLLYIGTLVIWWVRQYFPSVSWFSMFLGIVLLLLWLIVGRRYRRC